MTEEFMKALTHELSDACIGVIKQHGEEIEQSSAHQVATCLVNTACDVLKRITTVKDDFLIATEISSVSEVVKNLIKERNTQK